VIRLVLTPPALSRYLLQKNTSDMSDIKHEFLLPLSSARLVLLVFLRTRREFAAAEYFILVSALE